MRRQLGIAVALAVIGGLAAAMLGQSASAATLSGSSFNPGNIVSDAVFFDSAAMTQSAVQTFLAQKEGSCGNTNCLSDYRQTTASRSVDAMCSAYTGAASEPASQIIAKVAAACGINPRVLLVTLQKEQGLVTATAPSTTALARAMGYGCPDGSGCNTTYSGLYNQLYWAAWQFKRYANPAGTSAAFTAYKPGTTASIAYSPNSPCGVARVTIQNQATADLYYYTPYTPNAAALANLRGTGDSCSSYGNRNFWVYFTDWFGSPTIVASDPVVGHVDAVTGGLGQLTVRGWAFSSTTPTKTATVVVSAAGTASTLTANLSRPDVGAAYPAAGALHGFSGTIGAPAGTYAVCVSGGATAGTAQPISCTSATVTSASPIGSVDSVSAAPAGVRVVGWAADPETSASIGARVTVDGGKPTTITAALSRPDVAAAHPGLGSAHGYAAVVAASAGTHTICVQGINVGRGSDASVGCKTVIVIGSSPAGKVESVTTTPTSISLRGWAIDGDTTASTRVAVYVDGKGTAVANASAARSDIALAYPLYGAAHGFATTVKTTLGKHQVCVYGLDVLGTPGSNALLSCTTVTTDRLPVGRLDSVAVSGPTVSERGWAFDPDTASSISVAIYVDAAGSVAKASTARPDVAAAYKLRSALHGYVAKQTVTAGEHRVCAYGLDSAGGGHTLLGCQTVTVK
ncbi:hypothetical protein AX769_18020 [Frondihabitans sp. PAMC 28766]|uniref:hypothetical protein n=1 Tax=Frondihabitans sp. PAMC 28766 TaxID=1795630 RepID=UPI00078B2FF1|nr:hypothetical protein [Frondihabitans sp. PAMC 28766]AMM21697.1 hypothetical protein AX769_18020 [Frondihabitans sp. PAMC 28766]